jgi:hypothetical protein
MTVETKVNGDSKRTNERGQFLVIVCWACRAGTRDFCSALATLVGPVQNIVFFTVNYFNSFVPIAQQARQAAVLGRLSLTVSLWSKFNEQSAVVYEWEKMGWKSIFV